MDPDPADDDGQRRRSPSPAPDPDDGDGGSGWGSDKPPTRAEVVGKAAMEPSPSPPDSTVSDDQVALSSPAPDPEDARRVPADASSSSHTPVLRAVPAVDDEHTRGWEPDVDDDHKRTHAPTPRPGSSSGWAAPLSRLSRHDHLLPGTDRREGRARPWPPQPGHGRHGATAPKALTLPAGSGHSLKLRKLQFRSHHTTSPIYLWLQRQAGHHHRALG